MTAELTEALPPPQRLALSYASSRSRPAHLALLSLDARMGGIIRNRGEPLLVQMRLAWWRDMLRRPAREWPGGDPVLDRLAGWREPAGLAALADGWEALLADDLGASAIAEFVGGRGEAFVCLARQLGVEAEADVREAAENWALADLAANLTDGEERALVVDYGRSRPAAPRLSASLRPLAVLAGLGTLALQRSGAPLLHGPRSLAIALRIGFTGR
ncbi:conserved hypothetical protein [Altererythrobacter sp. B11]|uniref:hypothetical protein n=1 Tax=Altererythrobacter sp. B11 TaxID=2060312 RepID=UPI000DC703B7|nr:hypothetical protein [Altererythrobacter sp. B11]BBC73064.1 conserved hypothetical protein [Altererythrobacter sp. B11]